MANRTIPSLSARIDDDFLPSDVSETSTSAATPGESKKETRQQIGNWVNGQINAKDSVYVATVSPLNASFAAGTITANLNGALVIDGVTVPASARVLVKDQGAPLINGIYVVSNTGSPSTKYELTRASNYNGSPAGPVQFGDTVSVVLGTVNGATYWQQITPPPIIVNTTAIEFQQIGDAGDGTVTSVGLTMPSSTFTVIGSPVTSSGTLNVTTISQINTVRQYTSVVLDFNESRQPSLTNDVTVNATFSIFNMAAQTTSIFVEISYNGVNWISLCDVSSFVQQPATTYSINFVIPRQAFYRYRPTGNGDPTVGFTQELKM